MNKKLNIWNILLFSITLFYVYFLISQILFKYVTPVGLFEQGRYFSRSINIIPFNDLFKGVYNQLDVFGNIILFIPFGLIVKIYKPSLKFKNSFILFFIVSFLFEAFQYIFAIGASDVTDIIYNVLGGVLGIGIYKILKFIFKKEDTANKIIIVMGSVMLIIVSTLLILINIYN